jgi:hypothetical protein
MFSARAPGAEQGVHPGSRPVQVVGISSTELACLPKGSFTGSDERCTGPPRTTKTESRDGHAADGRCILFLMKVWMLVYPLLLGLSCGGSSQTRNAGPPDGAVELPAQSGPFSPAQSHSIQRRGQKVS